MNFSLILLVAIGLAMDCFAVSLAAGTKILNGKIRAGLIIGGVFGGFQAVMALLGWAAGTRLELLIASFDHWVAFLILSLIGLKMIYEGISGEDDEKRDYLAPGILLMLAFATSIDSLGVGLSLALLSTGILLPSLIIGVISLVFSFSGVMIGDRLASRFGKPVEIGGGIILMIIGLRILANHLAA
jgi:putative Mn2+ efflux pump MntP